MNTMTIDNIKKLLNSVNIDEMPEAIDKFKIDERAGVIKLIQVFEKRYQLYLNELDRLDKITEYEKNLYSQGFNIIGGIDEVGRGPLAGPVVTAVVVLEKGSKIIGVNDSKKLSPQKREELYEIICEKAIDYSVGAVSPKEIDDINILQATYKAMKLAVEGLMTDLDHILVDALIIPGIKTPQTAIVKGDEKSISIGAASIVAKVTRDKMMIEYDKIYPEYDFANNKGYGSPFHIKAIREKGLCPIHRRSFVKNIIDG